MRTVLRIVLPGLALVACASAPDGAPQAPSQSALGWAFGNTLEMKLPGQGYSARRHINPDGTWDEVNTFGVAKGTWAIEKGQVCYVQTEPAPDPSYGRLCYDPKPHAVGESWSNVDPVTFNEIVITVVAGRS